VAGENFDGIHEHMGCIHFLRIESTL
jgi:hypothetical protein